MNLVPANRCQKYIQGDVGTLPNISAWQSVVLSDGEELLCYQSDMAAAFYLFRILCEWHPFLAFNFSFTGDQVGLDPSRHYTIAANTIPMGWRSAVGVMQMISGQLMDLEGLPRQHELRRGLGVPRWLNDWLDTTGPKSWWQVYLDNFAAAERAKLGQDTVSGREFHQRAEAVWKFAGVVSAEDKRKADALFISELGAEVDGSLGWLSGGMPTVFKTALGTLTRTARVVCGRWVFICQFRRPSFAVLSAIWAAIYKESPSRALEGKARLPFSFARG